MRFARIFTAVKNSRRRGCQPDRYRRRFSPLFIGVLKI
nr:MAG TPA: hypothetical protein [Bacteriophage sp.]